MVHQQEKTIVKEKLLRSAFIIVLAAGLMLTAACGKQEGSQGSMSDTLKKKAEDAQTASSDVKDNDEASPAEPEGTKEADEQPAEPEEVKQEILTEAECRAKIELLRGTQPVHPTEARTLSDMAKLVAFSKVLNEQGAIFSKMDNYTRAILRSQIIDEIMWGESVFYKAIPVESSEGRYEADSLIKVDDAEGLFKDIYGEEDFTPAEYEHVEDGYILLSFGDGEPWHTIEHMQFFEDENYFLTSGPAFYEDNGNRETRVYDVVGPVCESADCFGKERALAKSRRGDRIAIRSSGAYGQVMASRYNMRPFAPSVYSDRIAEAPKRKDYFAAE